MRLTVVWRSACVIPRVPECFLKTSQIQNSGIFMDIGNGTRYHQAEALHYDPHHSYSSNVNVNQQHYVNPTLGFADKQDFTIHIFASAGEGSSQPSSSSSSSSCTSVVFRSLCKIHHSRVVGCLRHSEDGLLLATGSDRAAFVFDVSNFYMLKVRFDIEAVNEIFVRSLCFSPSGSLLYTGSEDGYLRVWSMAKKRLRHIFYGHTGDITTIDAARAKSALPHFVVSGSSDGCVRVWDNESGKCVQSVTVRECAEAQTGVASVLLSADAFWVIVGCSDTWIRIYETLSGALIHAMGEHASAVYALSLSPNGRLLASASLDSKVLVWGLPKASVASNHSPALGVRFGADGNELGMATGGSDSDHEVGLSAKGQREELQPMDLVEAGSDGLHAPKVENEGPSPLPAQVAAAGVSCVDPTQRLDQPIAPKSSLIGKNYAHLQAPVRGLGSTEPLLLSTLTGHTNMVFSICFSRDGRWLLTGAADQTLCIYDMPSIELAARIEGLDASGKDN